MIPTDELKEEHQGILFMLRILDKVAARIESRLPVEIEHLSSIVEFLQVFADRCHHGKEEELLFPALEKSGIPKEGGPIGVMLKEHQEGRSFIRGMADALEKFKKGESKNLNDYAQNARSYMALLTQHINKEDRVLFPVGEKVLSKEVQEELSKGFEKIEAERIGAGTHEELHKLLKKLEGIYLK